MTDASPSANDLPRFPAAVFRALVPVAERDEVLEDLALEFREVAAIRGPGRAHLWLWMQLMRSMPALVRRSWWRGWSGFEPKANAMRPGGLPMEQWIMDVRYAVRRIIRRPMYSALTCLTLALGIGGTAAAFGIARNVLLEPLPYADHRNIGAFWFPYSWTQEEFVFLRGQFPGFTKVAQYRTFDVTLELNDAPSRLISGLSSSAELFDVLGARPASGRTFTPEDEVRGAEPVVVLSHGLWQELGGNASVLGSVIRADGRARTVVGVMPRGFWFPSPNVRLWLPETLNPEQRSGNFALVGRVAPGHRLDQMAGPLSQLTTTLGERFTYPEQWDKTREAWIKPIGEITIAPMRPALVATLVAMGMILLIACANVAALMLAQVEGRTTELAVRSALGAHRRRITAQLVTEALLLGVVAGAGGAGLAALAFRWLVAALPLGAWAETAALDWRVFTIAMAVGVGAALVISLVPTLSLWRGRLRDAIGSGRTDGVLGRGVRLESALVVAEVAMAVLMAAGAGLLIRSTGKLYAIDPGFDVRRVGVADMVLPANEPRDRQQQQLEELVAAARELPGVERAAVVQRLPLRGSSWNSGIAVEGSDQGQVTTTAIRVVSRDYFATMGIPVLAGRTFEASDENARATDTSETTVVINQALAKRYFAGENPIGRRINSAFSRSMARIVGVVGDVAEGSLTDSLAPARYELLQAVPFVPTSQTLVFRTQGDPAVLLDLVRRTVQRLAPRVAVDQATTMERVHDLSVGPVRQIMSLVTLLTVLALLLGAVGIYGVTAHLVARRKRDWGIRIALGLAPSRVLSGIVRHGSTLVIAGIVVGLGIFIIGARLLSSLLYGVGAADPLSIAAASLSLLAVGVVAALIPATRASRTDPAIVLRDQ